MLTFDEARHEYRFNGVVVPGVTSLLRQLHSFAGVPLDVLDRARDRGKDVHLACQLFDEDDLDEEALQRLDPEVFGYFEGWKRFMRDCEPNWTAIEQPVFHKLLRYAGTPDRFGSLTWAGGPVEEAQVDIKTSQQSHPVWGIQTAAYNHAAGTPHRLRLTVQLRPDGTYKILPWIDPQDWPVFVSLTTLRTWKERHRL